jgi:hypothetical protein
MIVHPPKGGSKIYICRTLLAAGTLSHSAKEKKYGKVFGTSRSSATFLLLEVLPRFLDCITNRLRHDTDTQAAKRIWGVRHVWSPESHRGFAQTLFTFHSRSSLIPPCRLFLSTSTRSPFSCFNDQCLKVNFPFPCNMLDAKAHFCFLLFLCALYGLYIGDGTAVAWVSAEFSNLPWPNPTRRKYSFLSKNLQFDKTKHVRQGSLGNKLYITKW